MNYKYQKTCECENVDSFEVTRKEAAFNLKEQEIWNQGCSKCGSKDFVALTHPQIDFDLDLIVEWGNNSEYSFIQQDEELLLAEENNVEMILEVLDYHNILNQKRKILIEALCVIVYDNIDLEEGNQELKDKVANELTKRKDDVLNAEDWIMDYIKEEVFPLIGIEAISKIKKNKPSGLWNKLKQVWN